MTQGQRPKAECKVLPREILHQLPFPGSRNLVRVGTGNSPGVSLLPAYLPRGCLLEQERSEGVEQIQPFGHASAQLPAGMTPSTGLQESHPHPARPVTQLCQMSAPQTVSPQLPNWARAAAELPQMWVWPGRGKMACVGQALCSPVTWGQSCFRSGVVCLPVCGSPARCPHSGDTAVAKGPAAESPSTYCKKKKEIQSDYVLLPPSLPNIIVTAITHPSGMFHAQLLSASVLLGYGHGDCGTSKGVIMVHWHMRSLHIFFLKSIRPVNDLSCLDL